MMLECPPEEVLVRFLERVASEVEIGQVESHLEGCSSCRTTLALVADALEGEGPKVDSEAQVWAAGSVVGPYRLERVVGSGSMGEVFLAMDDRLGRRVALKQVRRRARSAQTERLLAEEARGLARVAHPNIVTLFDVNLGEVGAWLAMEYVEGVTLREWLSVRRTTSQILDVFRQVAAGLTAAHEAGVVHRDVKPANILVGHDGRVRVTDFGLAMVDGVTSALGGTPAYMAPEQKAGEATAASDQYSLCVVFAEALTSRRPTAGARFQWPSYVPWAYRRALSRGMATAPERRFPSVRALLAEIDRSQRLVRTGAAVALLCLVLGVAGALQLRPREPRLDVTTVVQQVRPAVALVVSELADGTVNTASALLMRRGEKTWVLTTSQVMAGAARVGVLPWREDRRSYAEDEGGLGRTLFESSREVLGARLVRDEAGQNLALLDVETGLPLPTIEAATSDPAVGTPLLAVGQSKETAWSIARGVVTDVHELRLRDDLDAEVLGAPLFDLQGRLLGLSTGRGQAMRTVAMVELMEHLAQPADGDRSTPERALKTCYRAYELGRADAWVDCIDVDSHWRAHQDAINWMLAHASPREAHGLRVLLSRVRGDYTSRAHALWEAKETYREMFSRDPPSVKASPLLLATAAGHVYEFPEDTIEQLRRGARIDQVVQSNDRLAWVLLAWRDAQNREELDSTALVKCGSVWCLREVPFPEEEALRPPGFPRALTWERFIEERGKAALGAWLTVLKAQESSWW